MTNGPDLWAAVLAPVREAFGSGVIAGGAVRDFLLGVEPKDIDIFVNVPTVQMLGQRATALAAVGFDLELMDHTEYQDAPDWVNAVTGVLDGHWGDHAVQIIARPSFDFSGAQLVGNFDFSITKCWFDGETHDTPEAKADRDAGTVSLTRWNSDAHVEISRQRFARFNARNGGSYTLIDGRTGQPHEPSPIPQEEEVAF